MSKLIINMEKEITSDVEALGYTIEYIEYVKEGENNILRIVIDKLDVSLTTGDCELVSKKVEDKIDELMKNDNSYILEVASPGLERALKNDKLYKKYIGYNVSIKLFKKQDDTKEIVGVLQEVNDSFIKVKTLDKIIEINKDNIACGNTVYEF